MRALPSVLQLLGLAILVAVCYALHMLAGATATGVALVLVGWLMDRPVEARSDTGADGTVA